MERRFLSCAAALVAAVAISACGGGGSGSSSSSTAANQFPPPTAAPDGAKQGGDLTVLAAGDVDYIDPGAAYYQFSYMIDSATQRQLASWQPDDVNEPTPDLASAPQISSDGLTITWEIKPGIRYSPPYDDHTVQCDDFKYAIERALLPGVANGFVGTYLKDVEGLPEAQKKDANATEAADVSGITCNGDTLTIKLTKTSSAGVLGALSLPLGSPVPRAYAAKYDAENPSTYGTHQLATGPYMIENNSSGETTGYTSGKEIQLVRNPSWDSSTDWRPAYLDSIDVQEGFTDTDSAAKKILSGDDYVNGDFSLDATSLKLAAQQYADQLTLTPSGGNRYIALNTQKPPFDDINVRKAVIAASNRTDLRNTRGGELVGQVATHYLPPGIAGFEEAGGEAGPDLDFVSNPNGDMAVAEKYMKAAGFSSGKCEGDCTVTMVGDDSPPGSDTAEVFKDQLSQLGFDVQFQKVAHDIMYTKYCNVPKNEPDVCPNVGWIKDCQDPQCILQPPFNGASIVPSNNSNWPLLDDPTINKEMDQAVYVDDPTQRAQVWGKIDDDITALAPAVPWVWDNQSNISSANVATVINLFNANTDLSFTSLK
ncbi:MAG: ABC transporter substrate-binding protein [Solirubrobacterales bacterium]